MLALSICRLHPVREHSDSNAAKRLKLCPSNQVLIRTLVVMKFAVRCSDLGMRAMIETLADEKPMQICIYIYIYIYRIQSPRQPGNCMIYIYI